MLNSAPVSLPDALTVRRATTLEAARPRLEALARRLVWDSEEARDVVQSALVHALDRWDTLRDEAARDGWLARIVVNRASSHLRRRRFWDLVGRVLLVAEQPAVPTPDVAAEQREHQARLAAGLATRSPRQSFAFTLRYLIQLEADLKLALRKNRMALMVRIRKLVTHMQPTMARAPS